MKNDLYVAGDPARIPERAVESIELDPRWQLVTRIADSAALSRAKQLREFLLYSSRCALENPGKPLSEQEIAQNVMRRRDDFDAAHDNIVRVQATHLRRKLETFFATEGRDEETIVALPKGTYTPVFLPAKPKQAQEVESDNVEHPDSEAGASLIQEIQPLRNRALSERFKGPWGLVAVLGSLCLVLSISLIIVYKHAKTQPVRRPEAHTILAPLLRNGEPVTIILPDLGLSVVQNFIHKEVDVQEYAAGGFPENDLQDVGDSRERDTLNYIGTRRAISYSELSGLLELMKVLQDHGVTPSVRFARDIHVRVLETGNVVLIGSRRSNPWTSLFADRTNFQFVEDPKTQAFYFGNKDPQGNEEKRYLPTYTSHGADGYIDVAILPNATNSGYVLLVDGSDAEVNESALRYLLEGNLPASLKDALNRPGLKLFEVLLRGRHLVNEADTDFQIISSRQAYF